MYSEIVKIAAEYPEKTILVVTHAASIRALWGKISGLAPEEVCSAIPFPSNASYSILSYDHKNGKLTPVTYSVDEHLGDLRTALPA